MARGGVRGVGVGLEARSLRAALDIGEKRANFSTSWNKSNLLYRIGLLGLIRGQCLGRLFQQYFAKKGARLSERNETEQQTTY